jgi:hypothetical protein
MNSEHFVNPEEGGPKAEAPAGCPASALPCLFVTTASEQKKEEEEKPLPGPRKKQADALTENIKWMASVFGKERVGFLTLTLGDIETGGRFRNLRDRKEAQRRFHSLMTNVVTKRYHCGVTITERHRNKGIHFHLAVACESDIRGEIDFAACFPPKASNGKPVTRPDYSTANDALRREWAFWRRITNYYGFGRHQLQPMRESGEALGRYLGEYLSKDWEHRLPEDKGARCVRYFGHWAKGKRALGERRAVPPNGSRFGWVTPRARMWRELIQQVSIVARYEGTHFAEETIKDLMGPKWAWKLAKLFQVTRFEVGEWQAEVVQQAILQHNLEVQTRYLKAGGDPSKLSLLHVTEITLDHLRPSPEWMRQIAELELAKECEAEIRKGLRSLAKRKQARAAQQKIFDEVAASFKTGKGQP